jgi:hypothetical protein
MKPHSIGRTLGIGLRVAGRIASQRAVAGEGSTARQSPDASAESRTAGQAAGKATRLVARGIGGFLRPFGRVGGILWLEVTGVFFLLPVVVFGPSLWRIRANWLQGPEHRTFLLTAGIEVLFIYLSLNSFWRARKK